MHQVYFFNVRGEETEFCTFFVLEGETFFDKLEEVLYIMSEITPSTRDWKKQLENVGTCIFDYHAVTYVQVEIIWNENTDMADIYCRDLEA